VVPAGGFAPGRDRWIRPKSADFFLPKDVLSVVFRGKFCDALKGLFRQRKLAFHGSLAWLAEPRSFARFLHTVHTHKWVVYVKKPFGGPEHVLQYLARYTHRVAISNHRLISMEDGKVTFRWKDYAHGGKKRKMTLTAEEFIRRFLLHVLPKGLVRIRHYGWMANRRRRKCAALCRALLGVDPPSPTSNGDLPVRRCPSCGGTIEIVEVIFPRELLRRRLSRSLVPDTS
jgi:hypothetical protein